MKLKTKGLKLLQGKNDPSSGRGNLHRKQLTDAEIKKLLIDDDPCQSSDDCTAELWEQLSLQIEAEYKANRNAGQDKL